MHRFYKKKDVLLLEIKMSPIIKSKSYYITRQQLNRMKEQKKYAPGYDSKGEKIYRKADDGVVRPQKTKKKVLKTRKFNGPFVIAIFKTGDSVETENVFTYQALIKVNENEYTRVWISPSMEEYTDAVWCDDDILLAETYNKEAHEFQAFQLPGEPTNIDNWDWKSTDDENHTNENMIKNKLKQIAEEYKLPEDKVYGVIILDC